MTNVPEQEIDGIDPQVTAFLSVVKPAQPRDDGSAALGKERFLQTAALYQKDWVSRSQAISQKPEVRPISWMNFLFGRKENPKMTALATIVLIAALLFGGTGATVYASQDSLPQQPLYGVKLASEDVRLGAAVNEQARLELALAFADRRAEEAAYMFQTGKAVPEDVASRWQVQVETALRLAAGQADAEIPGTLLRIRDRLRLQEQLVNPNPGTPVEDPVMEQLHTRLREWLNLVDLGLEDPQQFRLHLRTGEPVGPGRWADDEPPIPGNGPGPVDGDCTDCTPAQDGTNSQNPWTDENPVPDSSYGPGPGDGDCGDCTPAQDGTNSQNPWMDDVPAPGSSYGPGPGPTQSDPGPNPNPDPGPVQPGPGSPDHKDDNSPGGPSNDDNTSGGPSDDKGNQDGPGKRP